MGWPWQYVAALPDSIYDVLLEKLEEWAEDARAARGAGPGGGGHNFDGFA